MIKHKEIWNYQVWEAEKKKKKQRRKVNKLKEFMGLHQVDQYMIMGVPEREEREQQAYLDK